eukprot:7882238-Pyramimonas_sp.AAC.1
MPTRRLPLALALVDAASPLAIGSHLRLHAPIYTQVVLPLIEKAKRAILLSGTPALSRPLELHTQLKSLRPDLFSRWEPITAREREYIPIGGALLRQ